jgi:hypothetical protein
VSDLGFAPKIEETLGRIIVKAMQADDVECAIDSCASIFKAALRSVAAAKGLLPHKRRSWLRAEAEAIIEGQTIFLETGERPTKSAIRAVMEGYGTVFSKKHASARWREIFARAGLQNLADWRKSHDFYKSQGRGGDCAMDKGMATKNPDKPARTVVAYNEDTRPRSRGF